MYDVVIIGGGPAGVTAALRARELGAAVALVERGQMGGTCTNDGCAPTRVLAKTARLLRDAQKFEQYGLEGERPQLNWERLLARTHYIVNALHEKKQLIAHLQTSGIETFIGVGEAHFLNAQTLRLGDLKQESAQVNSKVQATPEKIGVDLRSESPNPMELWAEKFILCVGGHARNLSFEGAELALNQSDVWSLKELPRRVAIVGAAATGCQLASVLNAFGSDVTLLEVAPRILPTEDTATSQVMHHEFELRGIQIITGIGGISRLEKQRDAFRLTYSHAAQEVSIDTDAVLVAVGWVGNLEGMNLEAAGVETHRGYVKVSDALQTTAPNVFAAGDITGRVMLVQGATHEALVAAENAVRGTQHEFHHTIVPHGGFTDPEYGSVGLTEAQAHAKFDCVVGEATYKEIDRAVIDDETEGFCKLIVARDTQHILGAHVVGEQALEITQMVAAGMAAHARIGDLAHLEIAYPTYCGVVGLAARRIVRELGFVATDARWLELGKMPGVEWERRESPL